MLNSMHTISGLKPSSSCGYPMFPRDVPKLEFEGPLIALEAGPGVRVAGEKRARGCGLQGRSGGVTTRTIPGLGGCAPNRRHTSRSEVVISAGDGCVCAPRSGSVGLRPGRRPEPGQGTCTLYM